MLLKSCIRWDYIKQDSLKKKRAFLSLSPRSFTRLQYCVSGEHGGTSQGPHLAHAQACTGRATSCCQCWGPPTLPCKDEGSKVMGKGNVLMDHGGLQRQ